MDKKKLFVIAPYSLYGSILDNFNTIFNNNEVEVQLPFNFYYHRTSQNNYNDFLLQAQAQLNIENKAVDQETMDEIVTRAKKLKASSMLADKIEHASSVIPNCDQIVYISDSKKSLITEESRELSREVRIALENNKSFVNIDLQNLDKVKPYQNLYRLSNENRFLEKEYDFGLVPYHLYYVVEQLQESYGFLTTKPYDWNNMIASSRIAIYKNFENGYCLNRRNHFERLLMALCLDINDELNFDRLKYNEEMIKKNKRIVAYIDKHQIREDRLINQLIEYAVKMGKEVDFIDINRLKSIFLIENPALTTEPTKKFPQKIKSL